MTREKKMDFTVCDMLWTATTCTHFQMPLEVQAIKVAYGRTGAAAMAKVLGLMSRLNI